jgi:hypothetical protein
VNLLPDEMLAPAIAREGHDVEAVASHPERAAPAISA